MNAADLEAVIRQLHGESFGWALSCCCGSEPDAEDVLQNTYVKVLAGQARFEGRSAFRTWLFGVIRRTAQEHRRRELRHDLSPATGAHAARRYAHAAREWTPVPVEPGLIEQDEQREQEQQQERLVAALAGLAEMQRSVLHLVFYQGMTIADAAAVLDIRVGTARTHYERGKKRLRALLQDGLIAGERGPTWKKNDSG